MTTRRLLTASYGITVINGCSVRTEKQYRVVLHDLYCPTTASAHHLNNVVGRHYDTISLYHDELCANIYYMPQRK